MRFPRGRHLAVPTSMADPPKPTSAGRKRRKGSDGSGGEEGEGDERQADVLRHTSRSAFQRPEELDATWIAPVTCPFNVTTRATAGLRFLNAALKRKDVDAPWGTPATTPDMQCDAQSVFEEDKGGHVSWWYSSAPAAGRYRYAHCISTGITARVVLVHDLYRTRPQPNRLGHEASLHPPVVLKVYSRLYKGVGQQESERLRRLNAADREGHHLIVHVRNRFLIQGQYVVLVFPLLQSAFLREPSPPHDLVQPVALGEVRFLASCLLFALAFLAQQDVIHADLKPENIMLYPDYGDDGDSSLQSAGRSEPHKAFLKPILIDFGNACTSAEAPMAYNKGQMVTPRYRAPEILFGLLPITSAIDIWSLGCVLFELVSAQSLFGSCDSTYSLATSMAELLGRPPDVYNACEPRGKKLISMISNHGPTRSVSAVALALCQRLNGPTASDESRGRRAPHKLSGAGVLPFCNFVAMCLAYDPAERLRARSGLAHPFITPFLPLGLALGP